jgi:hypothetical protein
MIICMNLRKYKMTCNLEADGVVCVGVSRRQRRCCSRIEAKAVLDDLLVQSIIHGPWYLKTKPVVIFGSFHAKQLINGIPVITILYYASRG